jgi:hypothetical protein
MDEAAASTAAVTSWPLLLRLPMARLRFGVPPLGGKISEQGNSQ